MSFYYPKPRYAGENGEISAEYRRSGEQPDYADGPVSYHYLATNKSTKGEYGLYRVEFAANTAGPTTHFHRAMSEAFFILSGTMRLYDGRQWMDARAGDFLYVPPGGRHAFRNDSAQAASFLLLFAPGADREGYFENVSKLAHLTDEERTQFFHDHDSFFL
ncbi:MAG: cupin domain-containing protein [Mycobacterium sp.]|nr:cupin domain-containing protein [Mycobacterium sp.]